MTLTVEQWQERLAQQEHAWQEAEATTGSIYSDPPDGDYQGTVWGFDFLDLDMGAFLKIELQVASGPHQGRITSELFALEDPDRIGYTKGALATIGVDVANTPLSQVYPGSPVLEAVLDVPVEFTIKRSKKLRENGEPYVNVYINKALGGPLRQSDVTGPEDQQAFTTPPRAPADDDIPF